MLKPEITGQFKKDYKLAVKRNLFLRNLGSSIAEFTKLQRQEGTSYRVRLASDIQD